MTMISPTPLHLIHHTPLVRLDRLSGGEFNLYAKVEMFQPGFSIKDRAALQIIADAYGSGRLVKGQLVVEMTSGNMGAGLAVVCRQYGNPFVAVMSEGNSPERARLLKALGAEVMLTPQVDGTPGMVTGKDIEHAAQIARQYAARHNGFYVDQFNNPSSVKAHFTHTGPEIWDALPETDAFVASVGSSGTFTGVARFLKSRNPNIRCVAVEPAGAAILKTGIVTYPKHIIQGTGYGIIPPHWDPSLADDILTVTDSEAAEMTRRLGLEQGLHVGYSSGANVAAAIKLATSGSGRKQVVTVLCDAGFKYSGL